MAIGAHFDDVEINCGGTLAKLHEAGSQIRVVVVGDGDYQDSHGQVLRRHDEARTEGLAALSELGLNEDDLRNLKYPEKRIAFESGLIDAIEREISGFKPELILTHWPHDSHQDHVATAQAAVAAARQLFSIWMWEPIFPSGRVNTTPFPPQMYVDISGQTEKKKKALLAHRSQVDKFTSQGVNWIEGIEARAAFRGFECKSQAAEAFYVYRHKID